MCKQNVEHQLLATLDHERSTLKYGHHATNKSIGNKLYNCNDDEHEQMKIFNQRNAYCLLYVKKTKSQQALATNSVGNNSSAEKRKHT